MTDKDLHSMDTPSDPLIALPDWQARLADQIAAHLAAKERKRQERARFKAARDAGLKQRHARKLAQLKGDAQPRTPDYSTSAEQDR